MRILFLVVFLLYSINYCYSQQQRDWYIIPIVGNESYLSRIENKTLLPEIYRRTTYSTLGPSFKLNLGLDLDNNLLLQTGFSVGNIGSSIYSVRSVGGSNGDVVSHKRRSSSSGVGRISVDLTKSFKTLYVKRLRHKILNLNRSKSLDTYERFASVFTLNYILGASLEWMPDYNEDPKIPTDIGTLSNEVAFVTISQWGSAVYGGFAIQFMKDDNRQDRVERKLQLGIIYHQGLNDRLRANWTSMLRGEQLEPFNTISRGSMWSIFVGIPIHIAHKTVKPNLRDAFK